MIYYLKKLFNSLLFLTSIALLCSRLSAQSLDNVTDTDLQQQVSALVERGNLIEALPYLNEFVKRLNNRPSEQQAAIPDLVFFAGFANMQKYSQSNDKKFLKAAIENFDVYLERLPTGPRAHTAYLKKADCYRGLNEWQAAADTLISLLNSPAVRLSLTSEEREESLRKICQSFSFLNDHENGEKWFQLLLDTAQLPRNKSLATTLLIQIYIKGLDYSKVKSYFPFLSIDAPARYSPVFNVALLNGARAFAEKGNIAEAAILYFLVLNNQEMASYFKERLAYYENQIPRLQRNAALTESTREKKIEEAKFEIQKAKDQITRLTDKSDKNYITDYTVELKWLKAQNYVLAGRDYEAFWAFQNIYETFPDYKEHESISYSTFIQAINTGFVEEGIAVAEAYLKNDSYTQFNRLITTKLVELYLQTGRINEFYRLSDEAINRDPNDEYAVQLVLLTGNHLLSKGEIDRMNTIFGKYLDKYVGTAVIPGCLYWSGLASLFTGNYNQAIEHFEAIINKHSGSSYYADTQFRLAVAYYSKDDVAKAYNLFFQFSKDFPNIFLRPEAESFMGDIAAQQAWYEKTVMHYQNVERFSKLESYPNQMNFISHAAMQLAAFYRANQKYDLAIEKYNDFYEKYPDSDTASEALFELGNTYGDLIRPGDKLRTWLRAILELGDNPDALGVDSIIIKYNKEYMMYEEEFKQNKLFLEDMMFKKEFRELIVTNRKEQRLYFSDNSLVDAGLQEKLLRDAAFGKKILEDPSVLEPYLNKYIEREKDFLTEPPSLTFTREYSNAINSDRITLAFRLQMALDEMGELSSDEVVVFSRNDMTRASPRSLVWMAEKVTELGSREDAIFAYEFVIKDFPDSPAVIDALLNLAELKAINQEYDEAVALYQRVVDEYSFSTSIPGAILGMADLMLLQRNFSGARDNYRQILSNRSYRGPFFAEAMYKIGLSYELEGDLKEASIFFERTYLAYAGYPLWAAKACLKAGEIFISEGERSKGIAMLEEFLDSEAFFNYYNDANDSEFIQIYAEIQKLYNQNS